MGTLNRFNGAILGVAVGDALGAQAKGTRRPLDVPVIGEPDLAWTDQTQNLVLTGRALVQALATPYDRRVLGRAIANELVAWYHDPTTSDRYPGRSSLQAVVRLLEGEDWETSGNPASDGADPLPRAVAIGLAWPPDEVAEPAITATQITHRHPTALQAAVIAAWLVSSLVRGEVLGEPLVEAACRYGLAAVSSGKAVRSVGVALDVARRGAGIDVTRIDPREIPGGDCGQRSGSALGLAILLALLFDGAPEWQRLEKAVSAAARVPGAPEVVAALTGALLGVAWGLGAVPRHLIENTEQHDALADLARALHLAARGLDPEAERSGHEGGLTGAWDGGAAVRSFGGRTVEAGTDVEWQESEEYAARGPWPSIDGQRLLPTRPRFTARPRR